MPLLLNGYNKTFCPDVGPTGCSASPELQLVMKYVPVLGRLSAAFTERGQNAIANKAHRMATNVVIDLACDFRRSMFRSLRVQKVQNATNALILR
jgi:hypothetical protein